MPISRSLPFVISAWSVPVLIAGQFAMVALIPVVIVLVTALRNAGLRPLRWWAFALTVAYATALILWAALPDRAQSLSKDLHPVVAGTIIVAAIGAAISYHVLRHRSKLRRAAPTG